MLFSIKKEKLGAVLKENKKALLLFCVGLCAFAVAILPGMTDDKAIPVTAPVSGEEKRPSAEAYDVYLEEKLTALLKSVAGVGNVVVVVSLESSSELVPLIEGPKTNSEVSESDGEGGTRTNKEESHGNSAAILQEADGSESLAVAKTLSPKILGVVVSAKGADSNVTKERIYKAIRAFCGIGFSQIEILPMQE